MIAGERGGTLSLRRLGDSTLLLWALAGLAGGVPAVVFGRLSWGAMAALNAGFAVATIALAMVVAAWRERQGRSPLFLSPSIRQICLLLIPLGLAVQAAVIGWRPGTMADLEEVVREAQHELEVNRDPAQKSNQVAKTALVEAIRDVAQGASPEQRSKLIKAGKEISEIPPGQPLPKPQELPIPKEWMEDSNPGAPADRQGTPEGDTGADAESSPSIIVLLLKILTGPLRDLLGGFLGLGGGEEYRREATQIVLDLHQGRQPTPAAVASMLAKLSPEDQKKARRFLQEFVEQQPGPGRVEPIVWRCASMEGQDLVEGVSDTETLKRLTQILCQSPNAECSQIEKIVLVGGEAFQSEEEKGRILERLKEVRGDDCGLSSKPFRN